MNRSKDTSHKTINKQNYFENHLLEKNNCNFAALYLGVDWI